MAGKRPLRIRIITPLCDVSEEQRRATLAEVAQFAELGIEFDIVTLAAGPASIENPIDDALAAPQVVIEASKAEQAGIDAIIIDCMGDPGLMSAREVVSIPVVGPGEASLHLAAMMGRRVGCVSVVDSVRPMLLAHARAYGLAEKLVSVRTIDLPVLEIEHNLAKLSQLLYAESQRMIVQERVDTIVLGCTGFLGVAEELEQRLRTEANLQVPVVSPLPAAALLAASMVWGGLRHSRRAYPQADKTRLPLVASG